ncbi:MAG: 3-phenylpropionate/cinnamic acid dioxygenase small subunit [Planctomycetota bacterium]|jgi:3-phenylpropionate/cinnamic acid dioxygenase small subunit
MSAVAESTDTNKAPDIKDLEQFLFLEARLIDEQRWEEWNALFTDEGEYWVPVSPDQPDAKNHVSLMYETELLRAVRIKRFKHPNAFSLKPAPRCSHIVSNVMLDEYDSATGVCIVKSRFLMLQYRREEQDVFGGSYTHLLKVEELGFRIKKKRVDLINCDAPLGNILLYF